MTLRLQIVSRQRQTLRGAAVKEFGHDGGTIGRSLRTDWPLPDAHRMMSSQHASIDFHSGSYYIVDTSTNGVFINDSVEPVGKGKPQRLFAGDTLRIGEYEIEVQIDEPDDTDATLGGDVHVDPIEARQRVESPETPSHDLLDATEMTGISSSTDLSLYEDDDTQRATAFDIDTTGLALVPDDPPSPEPADTVRAEAIDSPTPAPAGPTDARRTAARPNQAAASVPASTGVRPNEAQRKPPAGAQTPRPGSGTAQPTPGTDSRPAAAAAAQQRRPQAPTGMPNRPPSPAKAAPNRPQTPAAAPAPRPERVVSDDGRARIAKMLAAFCHSAGIDAVSVDNADALRLFSRLGELMNVALAGINDAMKTRANQLTGVGEEDSVVETSQGPMRPLASSASAAVERLLFADADEYDEAIGTVRQTFADMNAHHRAAVTVLPGLLKRYLSQLDPEALEKDFTSGQKNRLIGAANRLRYWDLYRDVYLVMSQQADGELPRMFVELMRAELEKESTDSKTRSDAAEIANEFA